VANIVYGSVIEICLGIVCFIKIGVRPLRTYGLMKNIYIRYFDGLNNE
jgi:hypothetical protein